MNEIYAWKHIWNLGIEKISIESTMYTQNIWHIRYEIEDCFKNKTEGWLKC